MNITPISNLLESLNYITRQQVMKMLGDMLLDRLNAVVIHDMSASETTYGF